MGTLDGIIFADRVDLPFVTDASAPFINAGTVDASKLINPDREFAQGTAWWFAWEALVDFLRTDWQAGLDPRLLDWKSFLQTGTSPPIEKLVAAEITTLIQYAEDERADALGEIVAQNGEWVTEYMNLLAATPTTHPRTQRLLYIAALVGTACGLWVKAQPGNLRRRPSQVWPALNPPIPIPNHSAFPSGHATIAWLMTRLLKEMPVNKHEARTTALDKLATRIGRNREIAGLHYPSDTRAGEILAEHLFKKLKPMAQQLMTDACTECS